MPAYLIVDLEVTDPALWESYGAAVPTVVKKHGGKYLVRGGDTRVLEGGWVPKRLVVVRFPDKVALDAFWNDPEYQPLKELRHRSARSNIVAAAGV